MTIAGFSILTFDTYGTLIDWETGIHNALQPLLSQMNTPPSRDEVLQAFARAESHHQRSAPDMLYSELLAETYKAMAREWGLDTSQEDAQTFGRSVRHWPAFADAPASLEYLRQHFLMATLTNCDRISYMGSNNRLQVEWDAIYTAQDVGSYKPSARNFDFMLERLRRDFGILPRQILHVAQSLFHDHVPATRAGLAKAWINRRHDQAGSGATAEPAGEYSLEFQFDSMAAMVDAHRAGH